MKVAELLAMLRPLTPSKLNYVYELSIDGVDYAIKKWQTLATDYDPPEVRWAWNKIRPSKFRPNTRIAYAGSYVWFGTLELALKSLLASHRRLMKKKVSSGDS